MQTTAPKRVKLGTRAETALKTREKKREAKMKSSEAIILAVKHSTALLAVSVAAMSSALAAGPTKPGGYPSDTAELS
jgi:hypothetical protein